LNLEVAEFFGEQIRDQPCTFRLHLAIHDASEYISVRMVVEIIEQAVGSSMFGEFDEPRPFVEQALAFRNEQIDDCRSVHPVWIVIHNFNLRCAHRPTTTPRQNYYRETTM